jgi:hypothetical protein
MWAICWILTWHKGVSLPTVHKRIYTAINNYILQIIIYTIKYKKAGVPVLEKFTSLWIKEDWERLLQGSLFKRNWKPLFLNI